MRGPTGCAEVATGTLCASRHAAVVVVVTDVHVGRLGDCSAASPTGQRLTRAQASDESGAESVVLGVVAALLSGAACAIPGALVGGAAGGLGQGWASGLDAHLHDVR